MDVAVLAVLHARRPKPDPLPAFLAESSRIQQLHAMSLEQPADPQWPALLGRELLQAGHHLSAIDALERALQQGAPERDILRPLGAAYSLVDQNHEALRIWNRLATLEPESLEPDLLAAIEHHRMGERPEALKKLSAVSLDASGSPVKRIPGGASVALERMGSVYADLGAWPEVRRVELALRRTAAGVAAADALRVRRALASGSAADAIAPARALLSLRPEDPNLKLLLAQSLLRAGRATDRGEVGRLLEAVAAAGPAPGQVHFELARIREGQSRFRDAAESYVRAYNAGINSAESLRSASRCFLKVGALEDGHYYRGLLAESNGNYPAALQAYGELVKMHDCCQSGHMHTARVLRLQGKGEAALERLKTAAALPNPPSKVFSEMGETYRLLKRPDLQREAWEEFIRRDRENADVGHQQLGALADTGGRMEEAERRYRTCVELQPGADLYRVRLARLLIERRNDPARLAEAITHLEEAVRLAPRNADAFFDLGVAYRYSGRNSQAVYAFRHSIDLDPGEGRPYQPLGELLIAMGREEAGRKTLAMFRRYREFYQAWETLRARTRRDPGDVHARLRLAEFYQRAGAHHNALEMYSQVLALRPDDRRARSGLEEVTRRLGQEAEEFAPIPVRPPATGG